MYLPQIIRTAGKFVSNHAPTLLTGMGVAGVATTGILAFNAGRELQTRVEYYASTHTDIDVARENWQLFIPPLIMGAATVACIVGAHNVSSRRAAALMSAYSLTEKAFEEYREETKKVIGPKKENELRENVSSNKVDRVTEEHQIHNTGAGQTLMYDTLTDRLFRSDIETVRKAVNDINQRIINDMYASQNDFYNLIGLNSVVLGEELGWNVDRMLEINFGAKLTEWGEPCVALDYVVSPIKGYYRGH